MLFDENISYLRLLIQYIDVVQLIFLCVCGSLSFPKIG